MLKKNSKIITYVFIIPLIILIFTGFVYITSFAKEKENIIVGVTTDRCPMIYIDDTGEIVGIGVELLKEAAKEANLNIEFKILSEGNYKDALDNPQYDLLMPFGSPITSSKGLHSIVSNDIIETPFTFVTLKTEGLSNFENLKIGMLSSMKGVADTIQSLYPDMQIFFYDDIDLLIKALRKDEVDALLHNSYIWAYYLQKPSYNDLKMNSTAIITLGFKVGAINTQENKEIIDILNDGIEKITDSEKQAVILDYTSRKLYEYDIEDYLYLYRFNIIFAVLLLIIISFFIKEKIKRIKNDNKKKIDDILNKDTLTNALTFNGFTKKAEKIIKQNPDTKFMILYTNFKGFKYINDRFGKKSGDELLKFFVDTSKKYLKEDEIIGRLGRDHFVTLRKISDKDIIEESKEKIILPVQNYFSKKDEEIQVQMYCGIYVLTDNDYNNIDINRMIDMARIAVQTLQDDKKCGYMFYNPSQWDKNKRASEIISHLQIAINNNEIKVYYQPQVDFETNKIVGAEALCRWNYKNEGFISPGEFIPILEEAGLIIVLDKFVWESVCKDLARWNSQHIYKKVSINISRFDIQNDFDIVEYLHNLVKKYDIEVNQLNIEITETACVESRKFINIIEKLRNIGFKVEIDDFGSGYSSLNMLKEIDADRVKFDLRFLSNTNKKGKIIIECLIFMVKKLGMDLIAEGIETIEQANMLKELGCNDMQGYYFYKPLPVEEFEKI